jgi:hypothetical protein
MMHEIGNVKRAEKDVTLKSESTRKSKMRASKKCIRRWHYFEVMDSIVEDCAKSSSATMYVSESARNRARSVLPTFIGGKGFVM